MPFPHLCLSRPERAPLRRTALLLLALLALASLPAQAAITSKNDTVPLEKTWNPQPAADDILLPMPCNLQLALRAVAVPGGDLLNDRRFSMGIASTDDHRQLYERRFEAHIAAPFTPADLPAAWQKTVNARAADGYAYYFIGKYEISEQQWAAVMNESCPAAPVADADRPHRELSWYDAQRFLQKYNAWLVQNHADMLPHFADNPKNIGFLRLPTEEEWEFAARGGANVREEDREHSDMFPLNGGKLEDYALFTAAVPVHEPAPIGARKANPLGLYDTAGNVKELVDGFFRFSVADMRGDGEVYRRLHGAAGGVLCKGGSFRSDEQGVLPGWRDEVPQYTSGGESRPTDLGFRLVLSGLNVPSGKRLETLVAEAASQRLAPAAPAQAAPAPKPAEPVQQDSAVTLNPSGNPLTELEKISEAAATPEMRNNLAQLRGLLEDQRSAQERQRGEILENAVRALLYQEETLRSFAYRYAVVNGQLQKYLHMAGAKKDDANAVNSRKALDEYFQQLGTAANFYKSSLHRISQAPQESTARLLAQLRHEYAGADVLNTHMRQNIDALEKHLNDARRKGIDALTKKQLCKDIIPAQHFKELPFK